MKCHALLFRTTCALGRLRRQGLLFCAALAVATMAQAQSPSQPQPARGYVVEIDGAGPFTALLKNNLDVMRHADDSNISDAELERLAATTPQQIRELLATEGYFSPTITTHLVTENGKRIARIEMAPGAPVTVSAVDIRFAGNIAQDPRQRNRIERLRRSWKLEPGQRFRQAGWDAAKNDLLKRLLNRDYPAARIAGSEARIDPQRRSAQLSVTVDSGPAFTFGELQVQGLHRYSREMIDQLNPIAPGERFSQAKLNELQSRLQDTGYFRSAFATIDVDPAHPARVPVRVDLNENKRQQLAAGLGFSTDAGPRVQLRWLDRRFLGRDWRFESQLKVDRQSRLIGGDLYFPARDNGWRPSVGTRYEHTDIENAINDKYRTSARITSPNKADQKSWAVSYLADRQRLPGSVLNNRQALIASFNYTRRRLNNELNPRNGYVASVEFDAGPKGPFNERNLGRAVAHLTWLDQFERRWQTVLRAQAGQVFIAGRDTVPEDLLFRTGGDQSVRGYAYNSLGVSQDGAIVGGRVYAVLSAELVYRITPQWGAAVFTDAGNAADSWREFRFMHGSGVGARWRSPIGPVNLDLAYGHESRQVRLHFSVGYGF